MPGNSVTPEILFVPRRNPLAETWTGHMYSPEEVAQLSGIKEIWEASEFDNFVKAHSQPRELSAQAGEHSHV